MNIVYMEMTDEKAVPTTTQSLSSPSLLAILTITVYKASVRNKFLEFSTIVWSPSSKNP